MKTYLLLATIQLIFFCHSSSASNFEISHQTNSTKNLTIMTIVGRRLNNLWTWIQNEGKTEDNFIGRCFGVAKKLQFIMPLIIFKLGVIVTTLAFLTIFSLKSLALLVLLLVINTSGFVSKLALLKHQEPKHGAPPQNVHFHIHQSKDGQYKLHHSGPSSDYYENTWSDRNSLINSKDEDISERLKLLNLNDYYHRR